MFQPTVFSLVMSMLGPIHRRVVSCNYGFSSVSELCYHSTLFFSVSYSSLGIFGSRAVYSSQPGSSSSCSWKSTQVQRQGYPDAVLSVLSPKIRWIGSRITGTVKTISRLIRTMGAALSSALVARWPRFWK